MSIHDLMFSEHDLHVPEVLHFKKISMRRQICSKITRSKYLVRKRARVKNPEEPGDLHLTGHKAVYISLFTEFLSVIFVNLTLETTTMFYYV